MRKLSYMLMISTAIALVLPNCANAAQDMEATIKALQNQIAAQQKQIDALAKQLSEQKTNKVKIEHSPTPKTVQTTDISLSARLKAVEEKQAESPSIKLDEAKGLTIATADKQYSLRLAAYAHADSRTFINDSRSTTGSSTSSFLIRRARPIIDAKMTDFFNAYIMTDFGGGSARLLDAYGDFHPIPNTEYFNLRIGQFKPPTGLDRHLSSQDMPLIERGFTNNLVPQRDQGVMAYGQALPEILEYQIGIFNGAADIAINNGQTGNNKDVNAKLFAYPFAATNLNDYGKLGIGLAGSFGRRQGNATTTTLPSGMPSVGQRTVFSYSSGVFASGDNWRINPQLTYHYGSFGLGSEYVLEGQNVKNASASRMLRHDAWGVSANYILTGEKASIKGFKPANNFAPTKGKWGAFEVAGRISELHMDKDTFPTFASASSSIKSGIEATAGFNWYFNQSVKLNINYSNTSFDKGSSTGDREDENLLMTRVQVRY